MSSAQEQYTDEMKKKFGYYATWNPGVPVKLGDFGIFKDNVFTRISNVKESFNLNFNIREDSTKTDLEHNSNGSVTVTTKVSGTVAPQGSVLTNLDAGIIVEFTNENSTLFKANNTTSPSIEDTLALGEEILNLYRNGKWNKNWAIITEIVEAESASIIISNSANSRIELKANANIDAPSFDIADAELKLSTQFKRGLETKIIAQTGLTPLFKVMGIKSRIFLPPIFKTKSLMALDFVTPETAKHEHKNKLYFGYVSEDERE